MGASRLELSRIYIPHSSITHIAMGEQRLDMASAPGTATLQDAAALRDEVVLQGAVRDLENYLESSGVSIAKVVSDLSSTQRLLEFVLSGKSIVRDRRVQFPHLLTPFVAVNDTAAQKITDWLLVQMPDRAPTYLSSPFPRILEQFSLSLLFLSYPSPEYEPRNLGECHKHIQRVTAVLQSLAVHDFNTASVTEDAVELDEGSDIFVRIATSKQKKKRKAKQPQLKVVTDTRPFVEAHVSVPTSTEEAEAVAASLIDELKPTLKVGGVLDSSAFHQPHEPQSFITVFRHPSLRELFKRAYIPAEVTQLAEPELSRPEVVPEETNSEEVPVAYPMVQPMKAALYFDNADGFGEWRILISTHADSDLRYMRKKNPALFDITLNKIKCVRISSSQ